MFRYNKEHLILGLSAFAIFKNASTENIEEYSRTSFEKCRIKSPKMLQ
ncbi:hypothetical protein [Clostridium tagluense]|nr:hypothetical protein [Clostridium tagluense]MBU3126239.1 hypothetical protein [Clostridium tagluense]